MSKTVNRLTEFDGLYSVDRTTGAVLPISGRTMAVLGGVVTASTAFFTVDTNYTFSEDEIVSIVGAGTVNASASFIDGLNYISSVSSSIGYPRITMDVSGTSSTIGSASVTNQFSLMRLNPSYSHGWTLAGDAALSVVSTNLSTQSRYALKISPGDSGLITLSLSSNSLLIGDDGKEFGFNCLMSPTSTINVSAKLTVDGEAEQPTPIQTTIYSGGYSAIRSNVVTIPDDGEQHSVTVEIEVLGHAAGQTFYLTSPNLIDEELYYSNKFVIDSRLYMPDFYFDVDFLQENPKAPLHKLIDALSTVAGYSYSEYVNMFPYEKSEIINIIRGYESENHSNLVEPYYVKEEYAPWLAQFTGNKLKRNIIGDNEERLLPSYETENDYAKWQLQTGYLGIGAGSREAMIEAVKKVLLFSEGTKSASPSFYYGSGSVAVLTFPGTHSFEIGERVYVDNVNPGIDSTSILSTNLYEVTGTTFNSISFALSSSYASTALSASSNPSVTASLDSSFAVAITPRFNSDTFSIRIQTLVKETPDVTAFGQTSQMVLNAVEAARPLGYRVYHTAASQFLFTLDDATLGVIGEISIG